MDYSPPNRAWLAADEVTAIQAALLILNIEPQEFADEVEGLDADAQPVGYHAAKQIILAGLRGNSLNGSIAYVKVDDPFFSEFKTDSEEIDLSKSTVKLASLIAWVNNHDYPTDFLRSDKDNRSGFRDPSHSRYSPKLVAAVEAWENFDSKADEPGSVKQRMVRWLALNAERLGLTDGDGGPPSEKALKDIAAIANWDTKGGAPRKRFEEPDIG